MTLLFAEGKKNHLIYQIISI